MSTQILKSYKTILATSNVVEYEISNMEEPVPAVVLDYLNEEERIDDGMMWVLQESIINLGEMEMAYHYCPGVTQIDFRSTNGVKILMDYDDFKNECIL